MAANVDAFPEGTSYHEAGHAALAFRVGFHTGWIKLFGEPVNNSLGEHATVEDLKRLALRDNDMLSNGDTDRIILVHLAGPVAERIYANKTEFLAAAECDLCAVDELLIRRYCGRNDCTGRAVRKAELDRRCDQVASYLEEPATRALIGAIARELRCRRELKREDVADLCANSRVDRLPQFASKD